MNFLYSNINGGSVFTPGVSLKISYQKTKNVGSEIDFGANEMSAAAGVTIPLAIMIVTWIGFNLIPPDNNL